jgi:hypothetical protein
MFWFCFYCSSTEQVSRVLDCLGKINKADTAKITGSSGSYFKYVWADVNAKEADSITLCELIAANKELETGTNNKELK